MAFTSPVTAGALPFCGFCSEEPLSEAGFEEVCEAVDEEAGLLLSLCGFDEDSVFEEELLSGAEPLDEADSAEPEAAPLSAAELASLWLSPMLM